MKSLLVLVAIVAVCCGQFQPQRRFGQFQGPPVHKAVFVYRPDNVGAYRGSNDGRYTPDNSGSYKNNDGRYSPDNSGAYVHSDDKYKHQNDKYNHQADKFGNGGNYNGGNGAFGNGGQYNGDGGQYNGNGNNGASVGVGVGAGTGINSGSSIGSGNGGSTILTAGDVYGNKPSKIPGKIPQNPKPNHGNQGNKGNKGTQGFSGVTGAPINNYGDKYENNNYRILKKVEKVEQDGYHYLYETENGIEAEEQGKLANVGTDEEGMRAHGFYTYTGPDNVVYTVRYTADENGFQPEGAHIPTPPPVPAAILRALEYQRSIGTL